MSGSRQGNAADLCCEGRWEPVRGLRVFLREEGRGEPVLLLHGIPTSSYLWRDVLPVLARDRYAIAPDLVGFGCSDKPRFWGYSVASQAGVITALLDGLGIGQVTIVGHDLGALVAAEMLARDPARVGRLVVTNTSLRYDRWHGLGPFSLLRAPVVGEVAMALARPWMLRLAMRVYVSRRDRLTPDVIAHYWWPFDHGFKDVLLSIAREPTMKPEDFARWRAALAGYTEPALVVWGARDPTFGPDDVRDVAGLLPNATLELFEHANHFIQEDRPLALGRRIAAFLASTT